MIDKKKSNFYKHINKVLQWSKKTGWPFGILYWDHFSKQAVEEDLYSRKYRRTAYSKAARLSGKYEYCTGRKDKRFTNKNTEG